MTHTTPARRGRPAGLTGSGLLAVAREVFLERGYPGASMDEVAQRARVSKSSLYREHPSKDDLFAAVVEDWVSAGRDAMRPALDALLAAEDVRVGLVDLAATMRAAILHPVVMQMRRLVISEASAHPDVASLYLEQSWERNISGLADVLGTLAGRGALSVTEPTQAAEQLTWLVVGAPLNALLLAPDRELDGSSVDDLVDVFLAKYGGDG